MDATRRNVWGARILSGLLLAAGAWLAVPNGWTDPLAIPSSHPRLWWNAERLASARTWYAAHPFTPSSDDRIGMAFRYLMTGETAYARQAITWALGTTITITGVSDGARWYGEQVILIYDWCYD